MSWQLHHVGIVVRNIEEYLERAVWTARGPAVADPVQQARLCLCDMTGAVALELVEPLHERSLVWSALQRGGGWHHLCFTVPTAAAGDALVDEHRLLPVTPWEPAVLFGGRLVRFVYSRNRELLELLADAIPG